jgi:hypothetical protein
MHDNPLRLPFINVSRNAGTDDACVKRFLGFDVEEKTATGIVRECGSRRVGCVLYDIWGSIILQTPRNIEVDRECSAVVYAGHIYPVDDAEEPRLPMLPLYKYSSPTVMYEGFKDTHSVWFQHGSMYYFGQPVDEELDPDKEPHPGTYVPDDVALEEWMTPLFRAVPVCDGFDPDTLKTLKAATQSLYICNHEQVQPDTKLFGIDLNKCYYNTLLDLAYNRNLWTTDVFRTWEMCDADIDIETHAWYAVQSSLERYGFRNQVVSGEIIELFHKYGIMVAPYAILKFRPLSSLTCEAIIDILNEWKDDPIKQKKFALVSGMFGKIRNTCTYWFETSGCGPEERKYYTDEYGFHDAGTLMHRTVDQLNTMNRFHIHAAIVMGANARILRAMLAVLDRTGKLPVHVKTDSLMYRELDLTTPFVRACVRLADSLSDIFIRGGWKLQRATGLTPTESHYAPVSVSGIGMPTAFENKTFYGAPGTGKTYTIVNSVDYDLAVCFSNKGARRVNGSTIHSAFQIWTDEGRPTLDHLRNKTIFVDEAHCVGRRLWGMFMMAYLFVGTRFVFSLDINQLSPVGEDPIELIPFFGKIEKMTIDYRNDLDLQHARIQVLNGMFIPWCVYGDYNQGMYTEINIAYTNRTCEFVNQLIFNQWLGLELGDDGRYMAKRTTRELGWMKNEFFDRRGEYMHSHSSDLAVFVPREDVRKHFDLAYCTTIHKQIGETITKPFTIWEWDHPQMVADKRVQYTAITRGVRLGDITFRADPGIDIRADKRDKYLTTAVSAALSS